MFWDSISSTLAHTASQGSKTLRFANVRAHGRRQTVGGLQVVDQLLQRHADALDLDAIPQRPLELAILERGHLVADIVASTREPAEEARRIFLSDKKLLTIVPNTLLVR
jgi:hypothetical protein